MYSLDTHLCSIQNRMCADKMHEHFFDLQKLVEALHFDFHAVFMHCVSEIDPCAGVSCGHGTCTAHGRTSHACDCDPGYAGDNCKTGNYVDEHIFSYACFLFNHRLICLKEGYTSRLTFYNRRMIVPSKGGRNISLVVFGLAVHSVAGSILLWGNYPVEGIFPLELTWVQTPFSQKLFWMRV